MVSSHQPSAANLQFPAVVRVCGRPATRMRGDWFIRRLEANSVRLQIDDQWSASIQMLAAGGWRLEA
jgi:hypothetical protein